MTQYVIYLLKISNEKINLSVRDQYFLGCVQEE